MAEWVLLSEKQNLLRKRPLWDRERMRAAFK